MRQRIFLTSELKLGGDIQVTVNSFLTSSASKFSINQYIDPSDGQHWDETELSGDERGHHYEYTVNSSSDTVYLYSPFRVFDTETFLFTEGLASLRAEPKFRRFGGSTEEARKIPSSIIQDFSLSVKDFDVFRSRVEGDSGSLKNCSVSLETMQEIVKNYHAELTAGNKALIALRKAQAEVEGNDTYQAAHHALSLFRDLQRQVSERTKHVNDMHKIFLKSTSDEISIARMQGTIDTQSAASSQLLGVDVALETRKIEAKLKFALNGTTEKFHLGRLSDELSLLKPYFRQLDSVSVDKQQRLVIELVGIQLILSEEGVIAEGTPEAIYRYFNREIPASDDDAISKLDGHRTSGLFVMNSDLGDSEIIE